nr:MAG TPA: hypothetical protein [Caudoviricetes sp.]
MFILIPLNKCNHNYRINSNGSNSPTKPLLRVAYAYPLPVPLNAL